MAIFSAFFESCFFASSDSFEVLGRFGDGGADSESLSDSFWASSSSARFGIGFRFWGTGKLGVGGRGDDFCCLELLVLLMSFFGELRVFLGDFLPPRLEPM
jgi:hypothetical protein